MPIKQPGKVNEFVAGFDSECLNCPETIWAGDEAGYLPDDDYASCGKCVREYKEGKLE